MPTTRAQRERAKLHSPEILLSIFSHFCLHCCGEYDQPSRGTPEQRFTKRREEPQEKKPCSEYWYSQGRRTLASLCLVSKIFRSLAQPLLYHEFTLGYGESRDAVLHEHRRLASLTAFLQTIQQRPDLARRVKHVYFDPSMLNAIIDQFRVGEVWQGNRAQ
ncbi:hypothetical protein QQX98_001748 [Neonectria punicea]|uniref:F-box domain-containing protein n=1 Tax=Neonectria punicea TaxID=979145 RepID=A0ABR1HMY1_9HYPO